MIKKKKPIPRVVYSKNGTVTIVRIPEGTSTEVKKEAIIAAKRMSDNESSTYTSNYRGRKYGKKNQTSLFGGIL